MDSFLKTLKNNVYNYVSIVCDLGRICCLYIKKNIGYIPLCAMVFMFTTGGVNISFYLKVCVYSMQ